jgi:ADP-heptose:LPS heptosyltransferase
MSSVLQRVPQGGRVAIIRIRSMGDCILTTPAIAILKQSRPDLELAVVVERRFAPLYQGNPDLSAVLPPETQALRRWKPDLVINLHGGGTSARLTLGSGANFRAGFAHFRYSFLYNVKIPRAQEILGIERTVHTAEHVASAMFYLGAERMDIPRARLFAAPPSIGGHYALLHPAASAPEKTWPASRFCEVARRLKPSLDLDPVFAGAAADNLAPFRQWRTVVGAPLPELMSLMRGASLFIGNDSGPAHMAAAFGVPSAVIFGNSDPRIWAPWRTQAEVLTGTDGIGSVSVDEVMAAVERLRVRV